jgi:chemotaxis protein histidine kinase CheA
MQTDQFEERLAKVRLRFASTLQAKITDINEALPHLLRQEAPAMQKLADVYRQVHELCGIAPTLGFVATGKAARNAEVILLLPFRSKRGLTADEGENVQKALEALGAAAQSELQSIHHHGG